jgi:putative ABC transport system permease protein
MSSHAYLGWTNVLLALSLVCIDVLVSFALGLGIASSLIVASGRCILQLSLMGVVLRWIFDSDSKWAVAALSTAMLLLAANEITTTRIKHKHDRLVWLFADA